MSSNKTEITRLLELKKLQEVHQVLDKVAMQEKMKLEMKYKEFLHLNSLEMNNILINNTPLKASAHKVIDLSSSESDDMALIIKDYNKLYSKESWYKEPVTHNGKTSLTFPSETHLADFMMDQSDKHRKFIVVDGKTNKVIAYSDGDGILHHGDGKEFKPGDKPTPSDMDLGEFMAQRASSVSSMSM